MTSHYDKKISKAIRLLRIAKQIKQMEMALKLGMSESNYSKYENGKLPFLVNQLVVVADVLNLSVVQLIAIAEAGTDANYRVLPLSPLRSSLTENQETKFMPYSLN